jgi:hypothetical protein
MARPARWSVALPDAPVGPDGTARPVLVFSDGGRVQGRLEVTLTAERGLLVVWRQVPGTPPVAFDGAWSTV